MVSQLSAEQAEISRKSYREILRALAVVKQRNVAEALGISEGTVSKFISGDLERLCDFLSACGMKVVPIGSRTYDPDHFAAIFTLARLHLDTINPEQMGE